MDGASLIISARGKAGSSEPEPPEVFHPCLSPDPPGACE
jgi:hypothetical protein